MSGKTRIVCLIAAAAVLCAAGWVWGQDEGEKAGPNMPKVKAFRIERSMPEQAMACIECHKKEHPGLFTDWTESRHASANITCLDCHLAEEHDPDVSQSHYKQYERQDRPYGKSAYRVPVAGVVTPKDCSRCHPDEAKEYSVSKHANTIEIIWKIDPWLNDGMNSSLERQSGCLYCHGTVLKVKDGELDPATWPNVGVGRVNLDGSKGSCTSCHTRHRFSVMEARKPEACGQCHLGPDHPQIEIYMESKHGDIYTAHGDDYNWDAAPGSWTPGVDFRGPTCASCHMSGAGDVSTSHDVTRRLAWETQAPLTVRPSEFAAFPAKTNHEEERERMKTICRSCHGDKWIDGHFTMLDGVVEEYNEVYFKPANKMLGELYDKGLMEKKPFFDEPLEVEYYELWHHEGRRARMGAAMMAPDYAWWHGFYECKKRYNLFMREARHLIETGEKSYKAPDFPNATGSTEKPPQVFGKE
ncbi:MAG: multiheme c-type cytochrome [Desulfatibacillaceae bacterium]